MKISFLTLGKEKAELNVYDWNTGAISCYQKVGFKTNPNKTSELKVKGAIWKAINMNIEKKDWKG